MSTQKADEFFRLLNKNNNRKLTGGELNRIQAGIKNRKAQLKTEIRSLNLYRNEIKKRFNSQ